jgi:oligopeptide transport system substrate-binding protein
MKIKQHFTFCPLKGTSGVKKSFKLHAASLRPAVYKCLLAACSLQLATCSNVPVDKEKTVFRYNEFAGIATLDPAFAKNLSIMWAVHQLYNTLVETDKDLRIAPSLAKSWDISPDKRVYTFHLRSDVYFQDNEVFEGGKGRRMIASDVLYSFSRIMDKTTASSGAWIFNDRVDTGEGFRAIDDTTFQLRLLRPFNPIMEILTMQYCSVIPHEVVERWGKDFRNHPCGTGPFRFKSWEEGQALILLKNEHYFEKDSAGRPLPYLDAVKVSFFDDKATEFLLFRQGQLSFINEIDASFKDEVFSKTGDLKEQWKGKIILSTHPQLNTEYLGILVDTGNALVRQSPLRWRQVRQAINYGFDRRKMMMYLRNSLGLPAESGFVPAGLPSFDADLVKGYHYDPEKARRLLAEAGYPDGKGMGPIKLLTVSIYADFASFIARQLEELGIKVEVEVVQKSLLLEQTAKSEVLFFRGSWLADYPDAENYLAVFYSKDPAPPNYTRYSNPAFDRLYERSLQETDDSVKNRLYRQMDQLVTNDAPVVPLWYDEVVHLVDPRVKGFEPNALNLLELRRVQISK